MVPAMDLIVQKVSKWMAHARDSSLELVAQAYPVAYLEFVRNEDGSTTKIGPRNEKEELKAQDQWLVCTRLSHAWTH